MRDVVVLGVGATQFGVLEGKSIKGLAAEACLAALKDAGLPAAEVNALYLGNYASGQLVGQEVLAAVVAGSIGLKDIPATKLEAACASGALAVRHAYLTIAAGIHDVVLVVGVEKMTSAETARVTEVLASATDRDTHEGNCGLTFPGCFGLIARRHMELFGTTERQLASVAVKNRNFGLNNPKSHFKKKVTLEEVLASRLIAEPLKLYDCCPISDGAAALLLCSREVAREITDSPIRIVASAQASGPSSLFASKLVQFEATIKAAGLAYQQAGLTPADVDVAEIHDCFTIAEIIHSEDLGFFGKGEGGKAAEEGLTGIGSKITINPSGGLLAKGHPVGATGVSQVYEIVKQFRGQAANNVPNMEVGLTHNLGGTGAASTVHILRRG